MPTIPTKNLAAFFPLSAIGEDNVCIDLSGNMHALMAQNEPQVYVDDTFGAVVKLTQTYQGLVSETSSFENAFITGSTQFSITAWVYPTQNFGVLAYYKSENIGFVLSVNAGKLSFDLGSQELSSQATIKPNAWNFIAVTYRISEVNIIVNEHAASFPIENPDGLETNPSVLIVGNNANFSNGFIGNLSHLRIYNLTLSITDLIQVMKQDLLAALRIYLPFNKLNNNLTPNISQYPYRVYKQGQPNLQIDSLLSSVTNFNGEGDYFAIDGYFYENQGEIGEISISFWLKANVTENKQSIASFDGSQFWEIALDNEGKLCWFTTDRYGITDKMTSEGLVANGEWQYISVMYQAGTGQKSIYLGTHLDKQAPNTHLGQPIGNHSVTRYGTIGVNNTGDSFNKNIGTQFFQGSLAQFRIQHSILTPQNIQLNMANSYPAAASFQAYYPLAFCFNNGEEENTLYISDDATKHLVSFNITNDSDTAILFTTQESVNESNFQVAIYFSEGTLNNELSSQIRLLDDQWNLSPLTTLDNGRTVLYLNYCGEDAFYLDSYVTIQLHLSNLYASEEGGSRTARIGIQYDNLTQVGNPITGSEEIIIDIANNKGQQQLPLHIGFVDTNTVLNDGSTANSLTVRIMNIMTDENGSVTINGQNNDIPSNFYFTFDTSENADNNWALNSSDALKDANFVVNDNHWEITPKTDGEKPYWILKAILDVSLTAGACIDITISNIVANTNAAFSRLFIAYHNIPGYWDGKWILPILKSPIVVRQQSVGINTIPNDTIHLALGNATNGISYDSIFPFKLNIQNAPVLLLDSSGNCSVQNALSANGGLNVNGAFAVNGSATFEGTLNANNTLNVKNGLILRAQNSTDATLSFLDIGNNIGSVSMNNDVLEIKNSMTSLKLQHYGEVDINSGLNVLGTSTLNTLNVSGATTLGASLTINNAAEINASASTLNIKSINLSRSLSISGGGLDLDSNSYLHISAGQSVTGIPIITFKSTNLSANSKSGSGTLSNSITFENNVTEAEVILKSWSLNYTDSKEHFSYYNQVNLSCSKAGKTVTITAVVDLGDKSNNDGYSVSIDVVVIARLEQTIS